MMWQAYFRLATSLFLSTKKFISKKTNFPLDSYLRARSLNFLGCRGGYF